MTAPTPPVALKACTFGLPLSDADLTRLHEGSKHDALPVGSEVRQMIAEIRHHRATPDAAAMREACAKVAEDRDAILAAYRRLKKVGDRLSVCAQTTGGTAGPDAGLQDAIAEWGKCGRLLGDLRNAAAEPDCQISAGLAALPLASTEAGIGAGTPTPGSGKHDAPVPMLDPVHLAGGGAHVADAPGTFSAGIGAGEGERTLAEQIALDVAVFAALPADEQVALKRELATIGCNPGITFATPKPPAALDEHRASLVDPTVFPNIGSDHDEPSLRNLVLDYYRVHFSIGEAFNLRDRYFAALATSPRASGDRLREAGAIGEALGLFSSVIKSGEPWTDTCERVLISAREEQERFLRQLDQHSTALVNLTEHVGEYRKALRWYADHVGKCRMIHEEGEAARNALDRDCGARAEKVLAALRSVDAEAGK